MSPERSPFRKSRHGNQSYRKLVKKFNDVGLPFTDDQFRSADNSVFNSTAYKHSLEVGRILWKRPKELLNAKEGETTQTSTPANITLLPCSKWSSDDFLTHFCFDGPNQWFIAASLAVALHRSLLNQLINLDEDHFRKTGIVKFNIWQYGIWNKVVVDDKLASDSDDQLVFSRPHGAGKNAFWLPLLEKAYAKFFGSYEAMALNGSLSSALTDLTGGGSVQTITIGTENQSELIGRELALKSLVVLKSKDFKAGSFGLVGNRYYLVKHFKKNSSSGTLARLTSKATLGASPESPGSNQPSVQLIATIYDPPRTVAANSSFSFAGPKLQELTIPANEIYKHFDTLAICRPFPTNKDRIHRVSLSTTAGLQLTFDVNSSQSDSTTSPSTKEPTNDVVITLAQKSLTNPHAIGFRLHSVELNRRHKVHDFNSIPLVVGFDPHQSRYFTQTVRLPVGRYLLTLIANHEVSLMISICSVTSHGSVGNLFQLSQDMPRYQPISFMAPKYPVCVSRLVIHGVEGLEKQDRFGSANPYIILRHRGKVIKSHCQSETLNPIWENLSAVFYHKKMNTPIQVEVWHRTLLMDYFIGMVQLEPKISVERVEDEDVKVIESKILTDKKGVNNRPGVLRYELATYENLKHF